MSTRSGKLVLLVGPSGSGKGTLLKHIHAAHPEIKFPVSCTTRAMRPGETDGVQYHFIAIEEFQRRIKAGDFLEWAQYANSFYGTLKSELSPLLDEGSHVLLEIDMQGARQIMDLVPKENLLTVFVDAGTWEDLSSRITARAPITNEELEKRHARYIAEMSFKDEANTIITNTDGGLEFAKKQFEEVVDEFFKAV